MLFAIKDELTSNGSQMIRDRVDKEVRRCGMEKGLCLARNGKAGIFTARFDFEDATICRPVLYALSREKWLMAVET